MADQISTSSLFQCDVPYLKDIFSNSAYPWDILPHIKDDILELIEHGIEGFSLLKPGVLIGQNVRIADTASIEAPAIIGHDCEIRPGAYIRGSFICGSHCVLGNSSEFKNCILLNNVQCPHYNYIGDSILGNHSHTGAGAICSNLKSDGTNVVIHGVDSYETGLRKVGAFLADGADVGCGCVLNPGTIIGSHTSVYPLIPLRGVYPSDSIVKGVSSVVRRVLPGQC